jgi:hypothetical protein
MSGAPCTHRPSPLDHPSAGHLNAPVCMFSTGQNAAELRLTGSSSSLEPKRATRTDETPSRPAPRPTGNRRRSSIDRTPEVRRRVARRVPGRHRARPPLDGARLAVHAPVRQGADAAVASRHPEFQLVVPVGIDGPCHRLAVAALQDRTGTGAAGAAAARARRSRLLAQPHRRGRVPPT